MRAAGRAANQLPADSREPLVERHLVGRERAAVATEEAGDDRAEPGREQVGLDVATIGEARVRVEVGGVPERHVQADQLADRASTCATVQPRS